MTMTRKNKGVVLKLLRAMMRKLNDIHTYIHTDINTSRGGDHFDDDEEEQGGGPEATASDDETYIHTRIHTYIQTYIQAEVATTLTMTKKSRGVGLKLLRAMMRKQILVWMIMRDALS